MQKYQIRNIILIASLLALLGVAVLWSHIGASETLSERMKSAEEITAITTGLSESDTPLVSDIYFDEFPLQYDSVNNRWYYSLIAASRTSYDPNVVLYTDGSYSAKADIAFEESTLDIALISSNTHIPFIVYTDEYYYKSELVCTTLPLVTITTNNYATSGEHSDTPIGIDDTDIAIRVFDNREGITSSERVTTSDATAHIRGNSSTFYDKKSYKVSLTQQSLGDNTRSNDLSLLGMRSDDDWILYSAATEGERLRNMFSSTLWTTSCGSDNPYDMNAGIDGTYVELLIDGEYWGLYALTYPLDSLQLSLNRTENPATSDHIYRTDAGEVDEQFKYERLVAGDTPWKFEYRGVYSSVGKTADDVFWDPLIDYLDMLAADDETFLNNYEDSVYIDNAMDMWLYIKFTLAVDNSGKANVNFIAKYDTDKERYIMLFAPWDMDRTWGYMYVEDDDYYKSLLDTYCFGISRLLALDTENTIERLKARYHYLREEGGWNNDNIDALLTQLATDIWQSGAMYREADKWPTDDPWQQLTDEYALNFHNEVTVQIEKMDHWIDNELEDYAQEMKEYYGVD
jgi:hypothetical protein